MSIPRRRAMLTGMGAALAAGTAAAAAPNPDTDLIARCAAFDRLENARIALFEDAARRDEDVTESAMAPVEAGQDRIVEAIWQTRAQTLEGVRAKARNLALWAPDLLSSGPGCWDQNFMTSILRDLLDGSLVA
jgi:hypothetical protein